MAADPYRTPSPRYVTHPLPRLHDKVRVSDPGPYYSGQHAGLTGYVTIAPAAEEGLYLVSFPGRGCGAFYADELTLEIRSEAKESDRG